MITVQRSVVYLVASLVLASILAACGPTGPTTINVSLAERMEILLSQPSAPAGTVIFHITYDATDMAHDFAIVQTDLNPGSLPLNENGDVDEEQLSVISKIEGMSPGDSQDLQLTLEAGNYVIFCNGPTHYRRAMYVGFTVTP